MSHTVTIGLGSNLGDRLANLQTAIAGLPPEIRLLRASPVYETPPWGFTDQPAFLNQVIQAATQFEPQEVLRKLKRLEKEMGRKATLRYGPRLIDLDILLYDDLVLELPGLTIPHPHLAERAFVLVPLAELDPELKHPVLGETMEALLERVDRQGIHPYNPKDIE
jgi:2-amino-4-hydroxy-6-hydroxymethyldihydropteridine diphosphokinase